MDNQPYHNSEVPDITTVGVVASSYEADTEIAMLNHATIIEGIKTNWFSETDAFLAWNFF